MLLKALTRTRIRRTFYCIAATVLCLSFAVVASPNPSRAASGWTQLRAPNFLFVGDAPVGEMRRLASHLEGLRAFFLHHFPQTTPVHATQTVVVIFKDEKSYEEFKPHINERSAPGIVGHFQPDADVNYIAFHVRPTDNRNPAEIAAHELTHLLAREHFERTPAWFDEGFAEYYSTFRQAKFDRARIGDEIAGRALTLRRAEFLPLAKVLAADRHSPYYTEPEYRSIFYAQSWALVHYLLSDRTGTRAAQLKSYLEMWRAGAEPGEALRRAFNLDNTTLESRLRAYAMSGDYSEQVVNFDAGIEPKIEITSAPLTRAAVLARLGDLLLRAERFDDAESYLKRAVELDAALAPAHVSLGLLRLRQQRFNDARASLAQAIRLDDRDHLAHYYLADALNRDTSDADASMSGYAERTALMRRALQRAIALAPNFLNAYRLLAEIEIARGTDSEETAALLTRALSLAPAHTEFTLLLARLQMRAEKYTQARLLLARANDSPHASRLRFIADKLAEDLTARETAARSREMLADNTLSEFAWKPATLPCDLPQPGPYIKKLRFDGAQLCGRLVAVECGEQVLLSIETDERTMKKFHAPALNRVRFVAYTTESRAQTTCGNQPQAFPVLVTYRTTPNISPGVEGEVIAVEFVPAEWRH